MNYLDFGEVEEFNGVAISMIYNYFSVVLEVLTKIPADLISIFLFANGIAAVCGTSLFGYFIGKRNNLPIVIYPIVFAVVVIFLGLGIEVPEFTFVQLILFGLMDGSMHTISQYWLSSSIKDAPEIFIDEKAGLLLILTSVACFILASPTALYRIRKFPNLK